MKKNLAETAPPRASRPNGRPAYAPNEYHRNQVKLLASLALAQHKIASVLRISPTTLRKHFRNQLDLGAIEAETNIPSVFDLATRYRNMSATIFWAKTRSGFRVGGGSE